MTSIPLSESSQATENNQKLFRRYGRIFASNDAEAFASHAEKLCMWLGDFKAFYPAARPEIVKLLLIAQVTLRKALGLPEQLTSPFKAFEYFGHPMVEPYIHLVKAIEPFESFFIEPSLLAHVKSLLMTVSIPNGNQNAHDQLSMLEISLPPKSSTPPSIVVPQDSEQPRIEPNPEVQIIEPPKSSLAILSEGLLPGTIKSSGSGQIQGLAAPRNTTAKPLDPEIAALAKPKVKKRKPVDFSLLVQHDIKGLLQKQGSQSAGPTIVSDPSVPSAVRTHLETHIPHDTLITSDKNERAGPAVLNASIANLESVDGGAPGPRNVAATVHSAHSEERQMVISSAGSTSGMTPQLITDVTTGSAYSQVSLHRTTNGDSSYNQNGDSSYNQEQPMDVDERSAAFNVPPESVHAAYQTPVTKSPILQPHSIRLPLGVIPLADKGDNNSDTTSTRANVGQEHGQLVASDTASIGEKPIAGEKEQAGLDANKLLEPFGKSHIMPATYSNDKTAFGPPSLSLNAITLTPSSLSEALKPSTQPVQSIQPPISDNSLATASSTTQPDPMSGIFGTEMRIVASQQGLKETSRISVQFDIPESQFVKVVHWLNRKDPTVDVSKSTCLSLACYSTAYLQELSTKIGCNTFEPQTSASPSIWPQQGGLTMNVKYHTSREELPLSPPFHVNADNLVDVSQFLSIGTNVIELNQRQDLSQYIFVLHAHYPTKTQLKQVEDGRQKDKEWHDWLLHISRPLQSKKPAIRAMSSATTIQENEHIK
ncbi:hypothetical protein B0H34DRAFT_794820 [Crassisporium funariophilum]|nr:hypothetical protein B0H34DRAFT_794820 [Crassisporium funariophilum]